MKKREVMNNLPRVIGLSPSELSPPAFMEKLRGERERIIREIQAFRARGGVRKKGKKTQAKPKSFSKEVQTLLKKGGLTPEDLVRKIKEEVENGR